MLVPAAAVTIGELQPADRPDAWRNFRVAGMAGLIAALLGGAWSWRDSSRRGWEPSVGLDPKRVQYVVFACGGVGLLLSRLAAGTVGVVVFGFGTGFFPVLFTILYVIESRRRATASWRQRRDGPRDAPRRS